MSLAGQISTLATRIATEINAVRTEMSGWLAVWNGKPGTTYRFLRGDGIWAAVQETFIVPVSEDEITALTAGTAKYTFRMPFALLLTSTPTAHLNSASSSGVVTVDINENGVSIFGANKLTIDATETTSATAAVGANLSDASLADAAVITFDIDTAGVGATGLKITMKGTRVA